MPGTSQGSAKGWINRRKNGNDIPWNKGTAKPVAKLSCEERSIIASRNAKKFYESGGQPWNKGLTSETDARLTLVARKVSTSLKGRRQTPTKSH